MEKDYRPDVIEPKWQKIWEDTGVFKANDTDTGRPKYYILDMFPYPSGAGLHVGHPEGYTATDITARFMRMRGYNVLHPMGWDAFGLPTENYAIETGISPKVATERNIETFRRQIKSLGFSYDWSREINTSSPEYYRWTQWIFLQLYHAGLLYRGVAPINWCPRCKTGLANEEVVEGKCDRCKTPTVRRDIPQWYFRITKYAERLLRDLELLDWPESVKTMQENWIGRSEGAMVKFSLAEGDETIEVFTTRPDTLFGATYMVLAPEHPLVERITTPDFREEVEAYVSSARVKSDLERTDLAKVKTGVFTGAYAVNPVNAEKIPVWISDYVLISYGTGAIMAVPAHDQRDYEFAKKFSLKIIPVVKPPADEELPEDTAFEGDGFAMNSGEFDGLPTPEFKKRITAWLEERGMGKGAVNYRLRDWVFSRQRYWGEPIPLVHCQKCGIVPLPEEELPLVLPEIEDYKPTESGESPLARATDWVNTTCPACGEPARRETDTMPNWAGSCWYYLRYVDPDNEEAFVAEAREKKWMNVDLYVGGAEHAVLHLLYARFWHKALYDLGLVSTPEPFQKLVNQGMILGHSYRYFADSEGNRYSFREIRVETDEQGRNRYFAGDREVEEEFVPINQVRFEGDTPKHPDDFALELEIKIDKMSKSLGNVINPDDVVKEYGADSLRLYEMFMGPLESVKPWDVQGIIGVNRFLHRVWDLFTDPAMITDDDQGRLQKFRHRTIQGVTERIEQLRFNTAISLLMTYLSEIKGCGRYPKVDLEMLLLMLAPFAPHIAEECWQELGNAESIAVQPWPEFDPELLVEEEEEIVIQVNGKVRARLTVAADTSKQEVEELAQTDHRIQKYVADKTVRKVIYVPGKLLNIVVS